MLGQLKVKINPNAASAGAWFSAGLFTRDKAMDVITLMDVSGQLKCLIVDNKGDLKYMDIEKLSYVSYTPLHQLEQVPQIIEVVDPNQPVPKQKGRGTKQVTLEQNIEEVTQ